MCSWTPRTQHEQVAERGALGLLARDHRLGIKDLELTAGTAAVIKVCDGAKGRPQGHASERYNAGRSALTADSDRPRRGGVCGLF